MKTQKSSIQMGMGTVIAMVVVAAVFAVPALQAKSGDAQPADPKFYAKLERENNVLVVQCRDGAAQTMNGRKDCENLAPRDIHAHVWISETDTVALPFKRGNDAQTFWTKIPPSAWGGTFKVDGGWVYNGTVEWFDNSGAVRVQKAGAHNTWYGYSWR